VLVSGKEGNYSIDYVKMVPYLLKAFQDQQAVILDQQKEILRLKQQAGNNGVLPGMLIMMEQLQQQLIQQREEIKLLRIRAGA
jgi:hypothetical protein